MRNSENFITTNFFAHENNLLYSIQYLHLILQWLCSDLTNKWNLTTKLCNFNNSIRGVIPQNIISSLMKILVHGQRMKACNLQLLIVHLNRTYKLLVYPYHESSWALTSDLCTHTIKWARLMQVTCAPKLLNELGYYKWLVHTYQKMSWTHTSDLCTHTIKWAWLLQVTYYILYILWLYIELNSYK